MENELPAIHTGPPGPPRTDLHAVLAAVQDMERFAEEQGLAAGAAFLSDLAALLTSTLAEG